MWRKENDTIFLRRSNLLRDGKTEEEANAIICDIYGCTNRRIRNILKRKLGSASPELQAMSEALVLRHIGQLVGNAQDAEDHADAELDKIEMAESEGHSWLEVEESDSTGTAGTVTKKIPIAEAKKRWLENKISYSKEFFAAIRSLIPQTVLNQTFDSRTQVSQLDDNDLDAQLGAEVSGFRWTGKKDDDKEKGEVSA